MTRNERHLLFRTAALGLALTLVVVLATGLGLLDPLERWAYDQRARHCQFFTPPPTDQLVHVDIDDDALQTIGAWPWPRTILALILDEIHRAGAQTVAFDIIFAEAQRPRYEAAPDGKAVLINDDQNLAAAMRQAGSVLVPACFEPQPPRTPLEIAAQEAYATDLEFTPDQLRERLVGRGFPLSQVERELRDVLVQPRREAMYERMSAALSAGPRNLAEFRGELLPHTDFFTDSALVRLLEQQAARAWAFAALRPYTRAVPEGLPPALPGRGNLPPLLVLAQAGSGTAAADFLPDRDGLLRTVPLWVRHRDRLYPNLGLAVACRLLGADLQSLRLERDQVVIPRPQGKPLVIPVSVRRVPAVGGQAVGWFFNVPWFGPREWEQMYGPNQKQHLPILMVWDAHELQRRIIENHRTLDEALFYLVRRFDPARAQQYADHPPDLTDAAARQQPAAWARDKLAASGEVAKLRAMKESDWPEDSRDLVRAEEYLRLLPEETAHLQADLQQARTRLHDALGGRAALVGWTATGAAADFVPTSLHAKCPGSVVWGAIVNGILTGELWRTAPAWATLLATLAVGLLAAGATAWLNPIKSLAAALGLGASYTALNGLVLFDYGNTIVGLSPPLLAVGLVWTGGTLFRYVAERRERARITERFRTRVDPALVSYVIDHQDEVLLTGQERELTVVYTDIAGFTTLSEKLRAGVVPILNRYMSRMVPIIRGHGGYVNKFLGDGIMFFYGAPQPSQAHAADAVATVLKMGTALAELNRELAAEGLPTIAMRAGISTGVMVVGDAGSTDPTHRASDYTVLGDVANLGARLESANKLLGTAALCTQRTVELAGDRFGFRPIGKLQVVGTSYALMTYEPLAAEPAGDAPRKLAEVTRRMVDAFVARDFTACGRAAGELEALAGPGKLTALYRELSEQYLRTPPPADWDGRIVLREK